MLENTIKTQKTTRPGDPMGYLALVGMFNDAEDSPEFSHLTHDEILDLAINEEYLEQTKHYLEQTKR